MRWSTLRAEHHHGPEHPHPDHPDPGQVIEIYRTTTDKLAVKRTEDGTEENIFSLLDEDSDLLELAPGDNLLKATADSGETLLQVTVQFYPMVSGILPEVIA